MNYELGTSCKLAPAGGSLYQNYVPANEAYKAAIKYIVGQAEGRAIQVVVEKRDKVEELRTLKN